MEDYGRRLEEQTQKSQALSQRSKAKLSTLISTATANLSRRLEDFRGQLAKAVQAQTSDLQSTEKRIEEKRQKLQACLTQLKEMQGSLGSAQGNLMKVRGVGGEMGQLRAEVEQVKRRAAEKVEQFKAAAEALRAEMQQDFQTQKDALDAKAAETTGALDPVAAYLETL